MTTRRGFVIAVSAGLCLHALPLTGLAQQPGKVWRVGVLALRGRPDSFEQDYFGSFVRRMRELGYVEGKNLAMEWRFADTQHERIPGLAAELVAMKVDVIVASGELAIAAAQKTTATIPIVMGNVSDPVRRGFVESLARPGRNVTGVSTIAEDLSPKYLEILLSMVPKLSRVAVLMNPESSGNVESLKEIQSAAQRSRIAILPIEGRNPKDIESAFSKMTKEQAQAVIVMSNPLFMTQRRHIAGLAAKNRLPMASGYQEYVEAGALLSYGPSLNQAYRHAAGYVDKILKGAKPADLPVEEPTKVELVINGKTAKALGLAIPPSVLMRADRVIE